jgi:hypothetical protein
MRAARAAQTPGEDDRRGIMREKGLPRADPKPDVLDLPRAKRWKALMPLPIFNGTLISPDRR